MAVTGRAGLPVQAPAASGEGDGKAPRARNERQGKPALTLGPLPSGSGNPLDSMAPSVKSASQVHYQTNLIIRASSPGAGAAPSQNGASGCRGAAQSRASSRPLARSTRRSMAASSTQGPRPALARLNQWRARVMPV